VNILIANDDGVFAPGLQALAQALKPLGRVVVVAPESERSGYSSALTLDRPLRPFNCRGCLGCEWNARRLCLFINEWSIRF
jgi:5'/3'-nucleotidase SurE